MITVRLTPEEYGYIIDWGKEMDGLVSAAEAARDMIVWAAKHRRRPS